MTVTIFWPLPRKKGWYRATLCAKMTKIILVGSSNYPCGSPHASMLYSCACMWGKVPPATTLSAYHGCVTCGWNDWIYLMSGITMRPYAITTSVPPELPPLFWRGSNPPVSGHQCGPVLVTVEGKICSTGPLMSDQTKHVSLILVLERVARVNEEKHPVLFLRIRLPEQQYHIYSPLYPCLQYTA